LGIRALVDVPAGVSFPVFMREVSTVDRMVWRVPFKKDDGAETHLTAQRSFATSSFFDNPFSLVNSSWVPAGETCHRQCNTKLVLDHIVTEGLDAVCFPWD
jgi:hypothetical protein